MKLLLSHFTSCFLDWWTVSRSHLNASLSVITLFTIMKQISVIFSLECRIFLIAFFYCQLSSSFAICWFLNCPPQTTRPFNLTSQQHQRTTITNRTDRTLSVTLERFGTTVDPTSQTTTKKSSRKPRLLPTEHEKKNNEPNRTEEFTNPQPVTSITFIILVFVIATIIVVVIGAVILLAVYGFVWHFLF